MKIYSEEKWKKVRLEECAVITMGQSPASTTYNYEKEGIPFYQGNADFGDIYPKIKCYCTKPIKIANKEEILLSVRAPVGKINIANTLCCIGRGLCSIKVKENKCEMKFLYYLLKSKEKNLNERANGSTFKAINKNQISEIDFYLPNIEIQKKIVLILDKLVEILRDKKEILLQLEELSKSIFIEMFGDLNFKHRVWERKKFSELCQINPTKNEIKELEDNIEVSFIPMSAVSIDGIVNVAEKVKLKKVKTGFTFFKENDVLFAKITPCMENGKGGIVKNLKNGIGFGSTEFHVLRPLKNISTSYWLYYVTMLPQFRKNAENMMTGSGGQKRVPSSYFETLKINVPSIELQNQFAERIKIIEKSKIEIQKSIEETQKLFDSLMEKYFG